MQKNNFLVLKKLKNTESAQLCLWVVLKKAFSIQCCCFPPTCVSTAHQQARRPGLRYDVATSNYFLLISLF